MTIGLSFAVISTEVSEYLTTLPITPLKPSGFFGGTISSADFELSSAELLLCAFDSFEAQPLASTKTRVAAKKARAEYNCLLNCFFIFLFLSEIEITGVGGKI
jgi:hypothetical protein